MGKFYKFTGHLLGLLCASAFAVQALAADKVNLPVDRHGFFRVSGDTFRYPTTAKIRDAVSAANPHVEKLPGGGLSQSLPSNIEISATNQSSPISAKVKAGAPALKKGAKNLLKGGLAGIVLTEGLQALFDGLDWVMGEGGQPISIPPNPPPEAYDAPMYGGFGSSQGGTYPNAAAACASTSGCTEQGACTPYAINDRGLNGTCTIGGDWNSRRGQYWERDTIICHPDSIPNDFGCVNNSQLAPVSHNAIDAAVDNHYEPEPDDWHLLARHIDPSDPDVYAEIASIPSIMTPPTTKTIYDANGNPVQVQETNIWYDFDITDNDSKQPAIDIRENKETKTYNEHGQLTGTEITTSTNKASSSSSSSASADFDIPTDCEFMPTVCRFLAWFQEPDPELSSEPDLESLRHDLEPERSFEVGTSTAGCPEPITISLSMFPSVEVSLQPLCDFVDLLRPLLLAFASYFATLIVLRAF